MEATEDAEELEVAEVRLDELAVEVVGETEAAVAGLLELVETTKVALVVLARAVQTRLALPVQVPNPVHLVSFAAGGDSGLRTGLAPSPAISCIRDFPTEATRAAAVAGTAPVRETTRGSAQTPARQMGS